MNFVYPQFLYALLTLAIPVIIHLFSFRRYKKIYFSDVRFLKEVKQEARSRNKLKNFLILLARMLAVACLVLAFAQPFIPAHKKTVAGGRNAVSIYVDNSFSMENVGTNGMLLDEAKRIAREIILAYPPSDFFQLLSNDFEGKHQRLVNREEFLFLLDEIKISSSVKKLSEVYSRQEDLLSHSEIKNKRSFIISDYQKSSTDIEALKNDTAIVTNLIALGANRQNNLSVDSCWFESPVHQLNMSEKLFVRIKNHSENKLENIPVKLYINNRLKTPATLSVEAGEKKDLLLSFTNKEAGIQNGRIEINDYPVTYDDKFYFAYEVAKNLRVLCINNTDTSSGNIPVQSLFGKDSLFVFSVQQEKKIDYSTLPFQNLIILNEPTAISSGLAQELNRFVSNGGSLLIFPSSSIKIDTASYKSFLSSLEVRSYVRQDTGKSKIDWVNYDSKIFSDVFEQPDPKAKNGNLDLPIVNKHYVFSNSGKSLEEVLLKLQNKDLFFAGYSCKKGKAYLSSVPLNPDWSNLAKHALYVPLMYKIAINSLPATDLFYTLGKDKPIPVKEKNKGEEVFKIKSDSGVAPHIEIIPESRMMEQQPTVFLHNQIGKSGNYQLFAGDKPMAGIAFNYDRTESNLSFYTGEELLTRLEKAGIKNISLLSSDNKNMTKFLADISSGKKLWKWCILLVLLFLGMEILLVKIK